MHSSVRECARHTRPFTPKSPVRLMPDEKITRLACRVEWRDVSNHPNSRSRKDLYPRKIILTTDARNLSTAMNRDPAHRHRYCVHPSTPHAQSSQSPGTASYHEAAPSRP